MKKKSFQCPHGSDCVHSCKPAKKPKPTLGQNDPYAKIDFVPAAQSIADTIDKQIIEELSAEVDARKARRRVRRGPSGGGESSEHRATLILNDLLDRLLRVSPEDLPLSLRAMHAAWIMAVHECSKGASGSPTVQVVQGVALVRPKSRAEQEAEADEKIAEAVLCRVEQLRAQIRASKRGPT